MDKASVPAKEPSFVVVGNVNRGKSSIVSTLAADEAVKISKTPRTTTRCQRFPMKVDGVTLYTLIDSPGFERARKALAWLTEHQGDIRDRRKTVEAFVKIHDETGQFPQERELLKPILDGAAILYIVDGSHPFSPRYEAEMEILRWTGQPRLALINPVEDEDHTPEWKRILDQYFNLVRVFDAHQATFDQRLLLLQSLRELEDSWREPLDRAIQILREDRGRCIYESSQAIADLIIEALGLVVEEPIPKEMHPDRVKPKLTELYYDQLRQRERECWNRIRDIYMHRSIEIDSGELETVEDDLFSEVTWTQMGLRRAQLLAAGASAGAVTGGVIDASVGGASFMTGSLIGAGIGAMVAWLGTDRIPKISFGFIPNTGRTLKIGPMTNPNFPWILLNRALLCHKILSSRAHARRDRIRLLEVQGEESLVATLDSDLRRTVEPVFRQLINSWTFRSRDRARQDMIPGIEKIITRLSEPPAAT